MTASGLEERTRRRELPAPPVARPVKASRAGWSVFTGCLVALVGAAHVVLGVDAVARSQLHGVGAGYTYEIDIAPWGWIHVASGTLLVLAGAALLLRRRRARALGLVVALASAVVASLLAAYDPGRSLVLVALDVGVVWALCRVAP